MVEINVELKASSENLTRIHVLPTPLSPISRSLNRKSYVFAMSEREREREKQRELDKVSGSQTQTRVGSSVTLPCLRGSVKIRRGTPFSQLQPPVSTF